MKTLRAVCLLKGLPPHVAAHPVLGNSKSMLLLLGVLFPLLAGAQSSSVPLGYTACATENQICSFSPLTPFTFPGTVRVAYGANNSFIFMNVSMLTPCNNTAFGMDPAPGYTKTCSVPTIPPGYVPCAAEGGTCYVDSSETVAFGANGQYAFLSVADNQQTLDPPPQVPVSCSVATFQVDPLFGVAKQCYVPAPPPIPFQFCSMEGDTCQFAGPAQIAFGGNGNYLYQEFAQGPVTCKSDSSHFFGEDPAPNTRKKCYVAARNLPPDGYVKCADEWGICLFDGISNNSVKVAYGAPGAGNYVFKTFSNLGSINWISCNNSVFGVDPAYGSTKACFIPITPAGFAPWAQEGQPAYIRGGVPVTVAYGAGGKFVFQSISNGFNCGYAQFQSDPAPNVLKTCYGPGGPDGTEFCSAENGQCVTQTNGAAYFGFNDLWVTKNFPAGTPFTCNANTFDGKDPAPLIPKACFITPFPLQ